MKNPANEPDDKTIELNHDADLPPSGNSTGRTSKIVRENDAYTYRPQNSNSFVGEHVTPDDAQNPNPDDHPDNVEKTLIMPPRRSTPHTPPPPASASADTDTGATEKKEDFPETGTSIGELITEVCRNIVSGITGTRVADWNETIYEEDEPLDTSASEEEISAENFDRLNLHVELRDEIARGGQACINRGFDKEFHRIIAVKSLHDKLKSKEDYRKAFISEAKVTAQLEHPSIVPVYGIYEDGKNGLHLSMKLIRGRTLKEYFERTRLHYRKMPPLARKRYERSLLWKRLDIFQRVCEAISYVHYRKVIHRDLKPENIMIGSFNETYVMDWGIAEYRNQQDSTWSGKIAGTLQYIAPEIINKQPYDERSDIFLLGLILYEIVFLKQAYAPSKSKDEAIYKARHCLIEPFTHYFNCRVDKDLKMIIAKTLKPDPDERYHSVKELEKDLTAFSQGNEVSANPDNIFDKILRKVRLHYKILLFFSLVLLLSFTALVAVALYREMNHRQIAVKKDRAMTEIYARGLYSCSYFDRQFRDYEYLLSTIAGEAALLYKAERIQNIEPHVYTIRDLKNPETAPPDFAYAPTFKKNISLDYVTFIYPNITDTPSPEYRSMMDVLSLLKDSLRAAVVNSLVPPPPKNADAATINHIIRNVTKPTISSVFAGFINGLFILYPSRTDVSPNYDPRKRNWYINAAASPRQAIWSKPYVDTGEFKDLVITCSRAILDDYNQPIGVAGADVSLSQLISTLCETGNSGKFVKNKFLVDESGNIIADSSGKLLPSRNSNDELEFRHFPYSKFLPKMWEHKNGWLFSEEDGVNYLYFYLEIESLQWLYIERIDFEELLKYY